MAFPKPEELIAPDVLNMLTNAGVRLYCAVRYKMELADRAEIATTNSQLMTVCKLQEEQLFGACQELDELKLLHVTYDTRPGFVFSAQRIAFRFPNEETS